MLCLPVCLLGHFLSLPYPGVFEGGRRTLAHTQGQLTYSCQLWTVYLVLFALYNLPIPVSLRQLIYSCQTIDYFVYTIFCSDLSSVDSSWNPKAEKCD